MKLKAHPRYDQFKQWFDDHRADAGRLAETYHRTAGPTRATAEEIVDGLGAFNGGGRWNPPGVMKVVYLSREPETSMHEANAKARRYGLPLDMPKVTVAVRVEVELALDLTLAAIGRILPETMPNLLAEDWEAVMNAGDEPTAQAMGRAAFGAGLQGLVVPSSADPKGLNLVIFPQRFAKGCVLRVLNPELLEKLGYPR